MSKLLALTLAVLAFMPPLIDEPVITTDLGTLHLPEGSVVFYRTFDMIAALDPNGYYFVVKYRSVEVAPGIWSPPVLQVIYVDAEDSIAPGFEEWLP